MARDYSEVKRRNELPRVAFTRNREGTLHPLVRGRGIPGDVVEAKIEPAINIVGANAYLIMKVLLPDAEPVPWEVLERITAAEIAEGRWLDDAEGRAELPPIHQSAEARGIGDAVD